MNKRPVRARAREKLATILAPRDTPQIVRKATVEAVNPDGTVDLQLTDGVREAVECGVWYAPAVGDSVRVIRADPFTLFVLGPTRDAAPTTVTVAGSLLFPYVVAAVPVGAPAGTTGTLVLPAVSTRSYRPSTGWSTDLVYQGAYATSYGYWRGCYFYGTGADGLRGKTVTSATIRVIRTGSGGDISNAAQWVAPHSHNTQPSTAPYFTGAAQRLGYVDRNQAVELPLSTAWVQMLVNGDRRVRGFGHAISSTGNNYSINQSKAGDTNSGRLTISWRT